MGPSVPFSYLISSCLPVVFLPSTRRLSPTCMTNRRKKGILSDEGWSNLRFDRLEKGKLKSVVQVATQRQGAEVIEETEFFQPLADCYNAVLEEVKSQTESVPLLKFSSKKASSEGIHARYQTNIKDLLAKRAVTKDACDLVFVGEYKKYDNEQARDRNSLSIIGNTNRIMGSDPTRRFMFAMTVEYIDTRIWFFSRSHVFVTEEVEHLDGIRKEPISEVTDLKTPMICLGQVVKAFEYMYSADYVHRDIITGNILYSKVSSRIIARLGDLEYAKQVSVPSVPHRDCKIGTPHFIACEVESGEYLFRPNPTTMPPAPQDIGQRMLAVSEKNKPASPAVPFCFNYLHDLESVWWIMVFFLFTKIPTRATISHKQLQVQRDTCKLIFPHPFVSLRRERFFINTVGRDSYMAILPGDFGGACVLVGEMADFLRMQYGKVEAIPDFPAGRCFSGIHRSLRSDYFAQCLVDIVFGGPLKNLPPARPDGRPLDDAPPTTGAKRKMDERRER